MGARSLVREPGGGRPESGSSVLVGKTEARGSERKANRIGEPLSTRELRLPLLYGKGDVGLSNSQATAVGI